jgi:integrase
MGRPPLRLGQHGKIKRTQIGTGTWEARAYFRDIDGLIHRPRRSTPVGVFDRHGAAAEAELLAHLADRRAEGDEGITGKSLVSALLDAHMASLKEEGAAHSTLNTYRLRINYWNDIAAGLRVSECDPGRVYRLLERVRDDHGHTTARQLRGMLVAVFDAAVRDGALGVNPASAVKAPPATKKKASGTPRKHAAEPIDPKQLPAVLTAVTESTECRAKDLTDPILMHIATGLRVSEILGLLWEEFDPDAKTIGVTGRVIRATGQGLLRTPTTDSSKGTASVIALPAFAVEMLLARAVEPRPNKLGLIFPSTTGTLRDPNNFAKQWRGSRASLGTVLENSTGHSFRKTLGNMVTDHTADPRVAADVLGHSNVNTTLKHYLQRNRVHTDVATLVETAVRGTKPVKKRRLSKTDRKPTIPTRSLRSIR